MEKKYINEWTGKTYTAKKFEGSNVTLVRDNDGYTFTIAGQNFISVTRSYDNG